MLNISVRYFEKCYTCFLIVVTESRSEEGLFVFLEGLPNLQSVV